MAILGTDLLLVGRGSTNYKITASALATFIGGGGGGVTGVGVTAPITDSGTATAPIIGISAATTGALGAVQIGTNVQVAAGTISILDASDTQKGVIETATAAEAATGTDATLALTAATGVPKTPADMTGAALIPGGNDGARPTTPVTGMLRYNNQAGLPAVLEFYNGTGWVTAYTGGAPLNNVIYGTGITPGGGTTTTINHASVSLSNSYIIINGVNSGVGDGGVYISARTTTSFTVFAQGSNNFSYFLIY